jgi:hypothetical protein
MTALQWIIKEAKSLKSKYPKRFAKWTEYVAQASAIYASKHKGKSPVGKKKVGAVKKKSAPKKKIAKKKIAKKVVKKKYSLNKKKDKLYSAKKPGKRTSKTGNTYYESRENRSDKGKLLGIGNINSNYIKELSNFNNEIEIAKKQISALKGFKKQDPKYFKEGYKQELLDRYINRVKYLKSQIIQIKRQIK